MSATHPTSRFSPDFWLAIIAVLMAILPETFRRVRNGRRGALALGLTSVSLVELSIIVLAVGSDRPGLRALAATATVAVLGAILVDSTPPFKKNLLAAARRVDVPSTLVA
jgi:Kef-type K+ transport system membrane component KefB